MSQPTIQMLPCPLTDDEKIQRGAALAEMIAKLRLDEDAEASRKKAEKERLDELKLQIETTARIVRDGSEPRPVEVEQIDNTVTWQIESVRLDTREVYHRRPMTIAEREKASQLGLWGPADEAAESRARANLAENFARAVPEGTSVTMSTPDGRKATVHGRGKKSKADGPKAA